MEEKSQQNQSKPSEASTLTQTKEKPFSQQLREMPYDNSKVGQGFVMNWKKPEQETKRS